MPRPSPPSSPSISPAPAPSRCTRRSTASRCWLDTFISRPRLPHDGRPRDGTAVIELDDAPRMHYCKPASIRCLFPPPRSGLLESGADPDRHGHRRYHRRGRDRQGRRQRYRPGRSHQCGLWGMPGSAVSTGVCFGRVAARADRAEDFASVPGRTFMTPQDYEYLQKLLKARSGLVLSSEKHYPRREPPPSGRAQERAVQSHRPRLEASRPGCRAADRRGGRGHDDERVVLLPRQAAVRAFPRRHQAGAAVGAHPRAVGYASWCAAAATGQEPDSLAIAVKEMGKDLPRLSDRNRRDRSLHRGP